MQCNFFSVTPLTRKCSTYSVSIFFFLHQWHCSRIVFETSYIDLLYIQTTNVFAQKAWQKKNVTNFTTWDYKKPIFRIGIEKKSMFSRDKKQEKKSNCVAVFPHIIVHAFFFFFLSVNMIFHEYKYRNSVCPSRNQPTWGTTVNLLVLSACRVPDIHSASSHSRGSNVAGL